MADPIAPSGQGSVPPTELREIVLPGDAVRRLLFHVFGATALASLAVHGLMALTGREFIFGAGPAFDLRGSRNVVAWITALGFMTVAACCALAAAVSQEGRVDRSWRVLAGLAIVFSLSRLTSAETLVPWPLAAAGVIAAVAATGAASLTGGNRVVWLATVAPIVVPGSTWSGLLPLVLAMFQRVADWTSAIALATLAMSALVRDSGGRLLLVPESAGGELRARHRATKLVSASSVWTWTIGAVLALSVASLMSAAARQGLGSAAESWYRFLFVDFEGNLPAWFSSMLLAACAGMAATVGLAERAQGQRRWRGWGLMALGFAAMSCDEAASLHELLVRPLRAMVDDDPWLRFPLVVPGVVVVGVAAVVLRRFFGELPPDSRRALLGAGALFVFGALGLETAGGWFDPVLHGYSTTYLVLSAAEEACELMGTTAALTAMIAHVERHVGPVLLRFGLPA